MAWEFALLCPGLGVLAAAGATLWAVVACHVRL